MLTDFGLDSLATELHATAVEKGFWDGAVDGDKVGGKLALIHSEVTETLEAYRKEKGSHQITLEIADILIRALDLWAALSEEGIVSDSLDQVLEEKVGFNTTRAAMHGLHWG